MVPRHNLVTAILQRPKDDTPQKRSWISTFVHWVFASPVSSLLFAAIGGYIVHLANREAVREGRNYESLIKSIELLSASSRPARVGGILELGRQAKVESASAIRRALAFLEIGESDEDLKSRSALAASILASYLRDNATEPTQLDLQKTKSWPPIDIVIALKELSLMTSNAREQGAFGKLIPVDLSGVHLAGMDLSSIRDMRGWSLERANLLGSSLDRVNLGGAKLIGANLDRAKLNLTILTNANLTQCSFKGTVLSSPELSQANLSNCDLSDLEPPFEAAFGDAIGSSTTILPKNLSRPKTWPSALANNIP